MIGYSISCIEEFKQVYFLNVYRLILKIDLNRNSSNEASGCHKSETGNPPNYVESADRGYCSGLFRAPVSGGMQSATYCHNLPRPALAVRNLMEQVIAVF